MSNDMEQMNVLKEVLLDQYKEIKLENYPSKDEDIKLNEKLVLSRIIHIIWEWNS